MTISFHLRNFFKNSLIGIVWILGSSISIADILITKLDDITISTSAGRVNDLIATNRFCVASNPVGPYSLEALGSGVNNAFTIQNGPYVIDYEILLRDRLSGGRFRPVLAGVPLTGLLTQPLRGGRRCPGNAARLRMIIRTVSLQSAVPGVYHGSLQLTVIPE